MKVRMIFFMAAAMTLFFGSLSYAAGWQLRDMGVGLYVYDPAKYEKE